MTSTYSTQIRLPSELTEYIQNEAARLGVSQNAIMIMLMDMGRKVWDASITLGFRQEQ